MSLLSNSKKFQRRKNPFFSLDRMVSIKGAANIKLDHNRVRSVVSTLEMEKNLSFDNNWVECAAVIWLKLLFSKKKFKIIFFLLIVDELKKFRELTVEKKATRFKCTWTLNNLIFFYYCWMFSVIWHGLQHFASAEQCIYNVHIVK